MKRAHQFTPKLEPGAVGHHTLEVQRTLRAAGWESEIFSLEFHPDWEHLGRPIAEYARHPSPDDVVIYQYAIGSSVADMVMELPGRLIVNSHNQTPPEMLFGWDPALVQGVSWGIQQLTAMAPRAAAAIADSTFNAEELLALGYRNVSVVPVFTPTHTRVTRAGIENVRESGTRWLFVGRIAPNKMQHKVVQAFAWYRSTYDHAATLTLAGGGYESRYGRALRRLISKLKLNDAVVRAGRVSDDELDQLYADADVFVCLSEHEGFCVPVIEAMRAEVPVIARGVTALPETVGDAGVLLTTSRPSVVAAAAHRVSTDPAVRAALVQRGLRQAERFAPASSEQALLAALEAFA